MQPSNATMDDFRTNTTYPTGGGAPFTPERFGRYFLIDRIAVGGMAEIFRAMSFAEGGFQKLLVIKRILSHLSLNDEFVRMFKDEANVSTFLQHANIVQTYDFGRFRDNYYIAMEYVEGKDVKSLLKKLAQRRKLLPIEFAVFLALEACKGLDFAHRCTNNVGQTLNIVHRDMSPSNVIISYEGEVKLADFGIAKAAGNTYNTKDGVLKGKFEYMSPEQASGQEVDKRSDIFSTGIILYECLTGRRLFKSDSDIKTLERIKSCDFDRPSTLNPQIPTRLDEIVMRALARNPGDRYQDAREFQRDLLGFLYPATPDLTRQSLSHFLRELFSVEIAEERSRLEVGSRAAAELYAQNPEPTGENTWEEKSAVSGTLNTQPNRTPVLVAAAFIVILLGVVGFLVLRPTPEAPPDLPAPAPTVAALSVRSQVPGTVYLDGKQVGTGSVVQIPDIPPGDHTLRVEAEGYKPYEETLRLAAGDVLPVPVPMEKLPPAADPKPDNVAVAMPAALTFNSTPTGATVIVEGRVLGRTPLTWSDARAGSSYKVEYRLDGYQTSSFRAQASRTGATETYDQTLSKADAAPPPPRNDPPRAKETGMVSVSVSGGWASVYIDGSLVKKETPLVKHTLPAGSHKIRVLNEAAGIDQTRTVTVTAGGLERVTFSAE